MAEFAAGMVLFLVLLVGATCMGLIVFGVIVNLVSAWWRD